MNFSAFNSTFKIPNSTWNLTYGTVQPTLSEYNISQQRVSFFVSNIPSCIHRTQCVLFFTRSSEFWNSNSVLATETKYRKCDRIRENTRCWESHEDGGRIRNQERDIESYLKHVDCSDAGNSGETVHILMRCNGFVATKAIITTILYKWKEQTKMATERWFLVSEHSRQWKKVVDGSKYKRNVTLCCYLRWENDYSLAEKFF